MAKDINVYTCTGRMTRDPETRPVGDTSVAKFGFAVNGSKKNAHTGQWEDDPLFIDCEIWGKPGEIIAQYAGKGKALTLKGRLKLDQWEDKNDGKKRSKIFLVVEDFRLGGDKDAGGESAPPKKAAPKKSGWDDDGGDGGDGDAGGNSDIPF